jgi:hypothetical protein
VLTIVRAGTNALLKWPASPGGFDLQSATNLDSPVTWSSNPGVAVVVNGQTIVTNAFGSTQRYFRLILP